MVDDNNQYRIRHNREPASAFYTRHFGLARLSVRHQRATPLGWVVGLREEGRTHQPSVRRRRLVRVRVRVVLEARSWYEQLIHRPPVYSTGQVIIIYYYGAVVFSRTTFARCLCRGSEIF